MTGAGAPDDDACLSEEGERVPLVVDGHPGEEEIASYAVHALAAGVSKPTVCSCFGSKERLFRETMADIARQVNEASYEVVVSLDLHPDRWREGLHHLGLALSRCQREGCAAALSRLVLSESRRDPEVFEEVRRAGVEPIREALAGRLAMLGNAGAPPMKPDRRSSRRLGR